LQPLLETAGVADLVPTRTSSDDADRSKPDPDIVKAALKRTGVDRARAVMLGDTPYDVEAAARAAIAIVGLKCGGWTRADLCGAVEVYEDPADVLRQYDESIFYRLRHAPPQLERA
jgi:phosphoglycolate phosphatase-like HAD superfamily hydrolase